MPIDIIKLKSIGKIHSLQTNVRSRVRSRLAKESILTDTEDRAYTDISEYKSMIRKTCPR